MMSNAMTAIDSMGMVATSIAKKKRPHRRIANLP
jgi:hypothetical protein